MPIRDVFLPLLSYPVSASRDAIGAVVDLAENLSKNDAAERHKQVRTRVSAVILETEIESDLYFAGAYIGEFLEEQRKKIAANTQRLIDDFTKATAHRAVLSQWRVEKRNPFETQNLLVEEAKLHHITALPVLKDNDNHQHIAERLIFESGRPVLIFPDRPPIPISKNFSRVAVAWDGSRQAARAVADAMPFLRRASHVRIFTVIGEKPMPGVSRGAEIAASLASEIVDATFEEVRKEDIDSIGNLFESFIADRDCDLLVMGAYGHTRLREFVLGGATQSILAAPPTWVMLSH
ncbi:MAG: universal stress protein [Afipia sp.]|nr:universal stress protein [Afipia sp.]